MMKMLLINRIINFRKIIKWILYFHLMKISIIEKNRFPLLLLIIIYISLQLFINKSFFYLFGDNTKIKKSI